MSQCCRFKARERINNKRGLEVTPPTPPHPEKEGRGKEGERRETEDARVKETNARFSKTFLLCFCECFETPLEFHKSTVWCILIAVFSVTSQPPNPHSIPHSHLELRPVSGSVR